MKLSAKNEARRFISLIDALYEARCHIVCLADAEPEDLFFPDAVLDASSGSKDEIDVMMAETVGATRTAYRPNVASYDAPDMAEAAPHVVHTQALETLSIFSGKDEQFAFKRALSRLLEMSSESYQRDEQWTPLSPETRKWEQSEERGHEDSARNASKKAGPSIAHAGEQTDLAEEATYEAQEHGTSFHRPEAPRLHDEHFWGVREDLKDPSKRRRRTHVEPL